MISSKLAALLTTFVATSSANYFSLTDFVASDIRVPSASHHVSFHLTNPDTIAQEGGNWGTNCSISWDGDVTAAPECYTVCDSPEGDVKERFLARVLPGSYKYAGNFQVEIEEYYHDYIHEEENYSLDSKNAATVTWIEGQNNVGCSRGGQSDVCSVRGAEAWNVTYQTSYYVTQPSNICY